MATFIRVMSSRGPRLVNLDQAVSLPLPPETVAEGTILTIVTTAITTDARGVGFYGIDIVGIAPSEEYRAELRRLGLPLGTPRRTQIHIPDDDE